MKKLLKFFGIFILVILILLFVLPIIFKGKIVELAKEEINNSVNAKVSFGDFDMSLFSSFPDLTFNINDLKIIGNEPFEGTQLLSMDRASFDLDIMSVISSDAIKINEIQIDKMDLNAIVLEDGKANYDIANAGEEAVIEENVDAAPYQLLLDSYSLTNSSIIYDNRSLDMYMELQELNHGGSGDFSNDLYALVTETSAGIVDVVYEDVGYLSKANAQINADFDITENFGHFALKANEIRLNNLFLVAEGAIEKPKDGMIFDLDYSATKTDLKNVLSLIPKDYMEDLEGLKTTGSIKLFGKVFGKYDDVNLPGFSVNFDVQDGSVQYPDLPESIEDIATKAGIVFPGGDDFNAMTVDVSSFNMSIAESPINGRLKLSDPLTDPFIDAAIDAQVNLADLKKALDLESIEDLSGIITADIDLKGRMSAIENQQYDNFLAKGKVILQDMLVKSDSMPEMIINIASLDFSPQRLTLNNFVAKVGRSDFDAKGQIDNYLAYYLKDEDLKGSFNLNSKLIDLNEFMSSEPGTTTEDVAEAPDDSASMEMLEIPKNIDFELHSNIKKIYYDKIDIDNASGLIVVKNGEANLENVRMKVLGGDVKLSGLYTTKSGLPEVNFDYDIDRMDITNSAQTFNTLERFSPLLSKCTGNFSSDLKMTMSMDKNMNPTISSIQGDGDLVSQQIFINGFEPLNKVAEKLNMSKLASQNIENINFTYALKDGKMIIDPFDVILDGIASNVSGSTAITGDIDYVVKMKVPVSKLGNNVNSYLTGLVGNVNNLGLNLSVGQFVNMNVLLTGTMLEPKVNVSVLGTEGGQSIKEEVKDVIVKEINEVKDEAVEDAKIKAREEADKIIAAAQKHVNTVKSEASKLANRIRAEGQSAGDKLVSEAKNPIAKIAAKKASEKIVKQANKKADRIEQEANAKADKIISDARIKADEKLK
ncbi:MAG: hypothetical protein ACI8XB_000398 [Patiriisocius sp.]|jgi:hypothetical protein